MRDALRFFGRFVRNPGSVGAVLPSSRFLAKALVGRVDLQPGDVVLEYGPGTGAITAAIDAALPVGVGYLGIEIDAGFCDRLRERFPHLRFHCGSVADVERILTDAGLAQPKLIVSGLPFASLPAVVRQRIVAGTHAVLRADGQFRTFQYVHAYALPRALRFRETMREVFSRCHRSSPVLLNVPPAFVLSYRH